MSAISTRIPRPFRSCWQTPVDCNESCSAASRKCGQRFQSASDLAFALSLSTRARRQPRIPSGPLDKNKLAKQLSRAWQAQCPPRSLVVVAAVAALVILAAASPFPGSRAHSAHPRRPASLYWYGWLRLYLNLGEAGRSFASHGVAGCGCRQSRENFRCLTWRPSICRSMGPNFWW